MANTVKAKEVLNYKKKGKDHSFVVLSSFKMIYTDDCVK